MSVVRTINRVPEVYVSNSRDFQLLCNLFDLVNNGVKYDIDTMNTLSDTTMCRDNLLPLLQHKLGFFTDTVIDDDSLRTILKVFPYIVKKKGSISAIKDSITLFMYLIEAPGEYSITVDNNNYIVKCNITSIILKNLSILKALLKYVIPTGYFVQYMVNAGETPLSSGIENNSTIKIILINNEDYSKVREVTEEDDYLHNIAVTPVDYISEDE